MAKWSEQLEGLRFSAAVTVIYAIASFLGAFIAFSASGSGFALMVGASALVTAAAIMILLLLRLFVSGSRDVHVVVFLLISLGVGILRGVLMVALAVPLDLIPEANVTTQVVNSGVSAVVWLFLAALLLSSRERYRHKYRSLLVQGAAGTQPNSLVDTDWDHNPAIISMRQNLAIHMSEIGTAPSVESLTETSDAIRNEIENNLRPLSHRLWFGSFDEYPHVRLTRLIRDSVTYFRMPVWPISITWLIGGLVGGPMLFGTVRGVIATLISTVVLVGLLVLFRSLAVRQPSVGRGIGYLLVAGTVPLVVADLVLLTFGFPSDFSVSSGLAVSLPLALIAIMLMGLGISLANSDRAAVLAVAQRYAVENVIGASNSLEASTYIHNTLQSELTGVALQLKQAAQSGDPELSRKAMARAREMLNRSFTADYADKRINPREHAAKVAKAWQGICAVQIDMSGDVAQDVRATTVTQAAEELIANAVRHGGATEVNITLELVTTGIRLTGRINRTWAETDRAGLGTDWFATLSPQGVQTVQISGWTELTLVIE
jgi:hypothetical protein